MFLPGNPQSVQEHGGIEFFTRFENEMSKKFEEVNKSLDKAISEQRNAAERAASEMKQDILLLQKSVQGIVKALEEKPTSVWKNKKIPTELLVRNFPAKFFVVSEIPKLGCSEVAS